MNSSKGNIQNRDTAGFEVFGGVLTKYVGNNTVVNIPLEVNKISSTAFVGCDWITEINIPDSVEVIDRYAFVSCVSLRQVNIGFGIKTIPVGAFSELPNLESITVTDNLCTVEDFSFKNCKSLKQVSFLTKKYRDPVTPAEKGRAFELMVVGKAAKIEYVDYSESGPEKLSICNYAFAGCRSFDPAQLIEFSDSVDESAFEGCILTADGSSGLGASDALPHIEEDAIEKFVNNENEEENYIIQTALSDAEFDDEKTEQQFNDSFENVDEDDYDETEEYENPKEYLVGGFSVTDGKICCDASGEVVADDAIESLLLSSRSYNALHRMNVDFMQGASRRIMISDLLSMTPEELLSVRNMGAKSAEEIIDKLKAYLIANFNSDTSGTIIRQTIAPEYDVADGIIKNIKNQSVVQDITVSSLDLSVRAINSLNRGGVYWLSELVVLSTQQLQKFPYMGSKTVIEIKNFIQRYLPAHQTEAVEKLPVTLELPEQDPEIKVLAEGFVAVEGIIVSRKDYKVVADAPLESLDLSVRSVNCLMRSGKTRVYDLVGIPYDEFYRIRNLGMLSANEIVEKLEQYLEKACRESDNYITPSITCSTREVIRALKLHEYEYQNIDEISSALPNAGVEDIISALNELEANGEIEIRNDSYALRHKSFIEYVDEFSADSEQNERLFTVIKMRSEGATLEEVGQYIGTTRERVRQLEKKAVDKISQKGTVHFEEDRYAYLFTTYAVDREFFFDYMQGTAALWYYLNIRYTKGKKEIKEALEDQNLSVEIRRAADRYVYRGYVHANGVHIPLQRSEIEDYVAERFCKNEVSLDEFFTLYENFINEHGVHDERLQINDSIRETRSNRLSESRKILWKQNQRMRYYEIDGGDYDELLKTLNLGQYRDVEISTRKFLTDYHDLMARYDLRDEYEIHNLLKKIHAESENSSLVFSRMPNLKFGIFDRDKAVKEILYALAPISQDELVEAISLEYGTRTETVKANWLTCISEYLHQGMYSVDYEEMPEEHVVELKRALTQDFYFIPELKRIYKQLVPDADVSLISTYNLKKMGFLVGSTYALQNYPTAEAFFDHLLTEEDVIDIEPISKRYTGLTTYSTYLARIKHEMKIIEFEPFRYINLRRLEKMGFGRERLKAYGDRVWSFLVDDGFFTIRSLKKAGFEDELDSLGFGDMFYSSLLKEDDRFSWQRVGNAIVLNPKREQFTAHDFLVDRVSKEKAIDVDCFVSILDEDYGISFDKHAVIEKVKGSDVYYDSIMRKLYADYETYFEEV